MAIKIIFAILTQKQVNPLSMPAINNFNLNTQQNSHRQFRFKASKMRSLTIYLAVLTILFVITIIKDSNAKVDNAQKFEKSFKNLKSLKKMEKMISALQSGMIAATIIDEIGSILHGDTWEHGYFDHKFQLIGANMKAVDTHTHTHTHQRNKQIHRSPRQKNRP